MALPGWGTVAGRIAEWLPGRKEAKQSKIQRLLDENYKLAQETPLSAINAGRIADNTTLIKRLRGELERIN